ncbi:MULTISPECIES: hypothetical protein [Providencia]|uniref:hypothetical protein n=1 Tax=Providencia TaxID=586 RepID=UPI00234B6212|nr:hypothetical protein [Providencia sp. PROV191]
MHTLSAYASTTPFRTTKYSKNYSKGCALRGLFYLRGHQMKTIQVTVTKLNGSVSFEVHQNGERLVKDAFYGKTSTQFTRKYRVNGTSDDLVVTITHSEGENTGITAKFIN